jgi:hypothetical protein
VILKRILSFFIHPEKTLPDEKLFLIRFQSGGDKPWFIGPFSGQIGPGKRDPRKQTAFRRRKDAEDAALWLGSEKHVTIVTRAAAIAEVPVAG